MKVDIHTLTTDFCNFVEIKKILIADTHYSVQNDSFKIIELISNYIPFEIFIFFLSVDTNCMAQ